MASLCWGCSSKLRSPSSLLSLSRRAPFHSSVPNHAPPLLKKKQNVITTGLRFREPRNHAVKKHKTYQKRHQRDPIRLLKDVKNRIVLSNANALEVPDLQDLSGESMLDNRLRGKMLGLPMNMLDRLRAAYAFHRTQKWHMFRRPATLVRRETLELGRVVSELAEKKGEGSKTVTKIVMGERATGKSLYLVQAMAMGFLKDWIVINIPYAQDLVVANTAYAPIPDSNPLQYTQKNATAQLLTRIATANEPILSQLHLSQHHKKLKAPFQPHMSLHTLATMGAQDPELSWTVFEALWKELTATGPTSPAIEGQKAFKKRPAMMITMDDVDHWMKDTRYRSPKFEPVHAHDLVFVKHFLSCLVGTTPLPNGGMVLAATTRSNFPRIYKFDMVLKQLAAKQEGLDPSSPDYPTVNPYIRGGERVTSLFSQAAADIGVVELGGLSKDEARGLMEYLAYSGILREKICEESVSEKWTLAGGGVVGELERLGMRVRRLPLGAAETNAENVENSAAFA